MVRLGGLLLLNYLVKISSAGSYKAEISGRWSQDAGGELGMRLNSDEERVVLPLNYFHTLARLVLADKVEADALELSNVVRVDLVTMAVALLHNLLLAVQGSELTPLTSRLEVGGLGSEAHGAAHDLLRTLGHENDDLVLGLGVNLLRGSVRVAKKVLRSLDDGNLHSETDAEERDLALTSPLDSFHHSWHTSAAETARNKT